MRDLMQAIQVLGQEVPYDTDTEPPDLDGGEDTGSEMRDLQSTSSGDRTLDKAQDRVHG